MDTERSSFDLATLHPNSDYGCVSLFRRGSAFALTYLLAKLIHYESEVGRSSMAGIISYKVVVISISTVLVQENVFYLAAHVVGLFINIKLDIVLGRLLAEVARFSIGHLAVNVKVNTVIPRKAEANSVGIGNATTSCGYTLFCQSSVFASAVRGGLSSVFPCHASLLLELL